LSFPVLNLFPLMPRPKSKTASAQALVGLWAVALTAFVIVALYFARGLLIPFALSALLTFLISPLVGRLERWLGRAAAVMLAVGLIFGALGGAGWMLSQQLVDLATKLPEYKGNVVAKLHAFQPSKGGIFSKVSDTVDELKKELPGGSPAPTITQESGKPETAVASPPHPPVPAAPVKVVETSKANPVELIKTIITPLIGPLGTAFLVLILVIFMLFEREDLRSRLIRLIGQGRISVTTHAMDDAADRVSRYLRMQLLVNVIYGVCIAIALYFIGVPNALLWGAFGIVLRFIPYVGPWIAALLPTLLALAVSPGWTKPILTVVLLTTIELTLSNVLEPLLYGKHTGISSIALIIAAVFWTWLWGPLGLVLATPLTVCLVVMGRHVPSLSFLSVLLSDEEALTPAQDCYHRLLTVGEQDEIEFVEEYLKANSLTALYDAVFIPVITVAENDARLDALDDEQLNQIKQSIRDMIEDLGTRPALALHTAGDDVVAEQETRTKTPMPAMAVSYRVCCLPAREERDELAGAMLAQLLQQRGFEAISAPGKLAAGELLSFAEKPDVDVVCISVVAPSTIIHARYLCKKVRTKFPKVKIIVGLWGTATENKAESAQRLRDSGADEVVVSLAEAVEQIIKSAPLLTEGMSPAPIPEDEEERLATLAELQLLDTEAEPAFDRIISKLARVFEMPIALISLVDRHRLFFKSHIGLPEDLAESRQVSRDISVCGHVVSHNEVTVIEDLARDRRFANNPWIRERGLRFYAGAPLRAPNGQPIGSLCLLDVKPREFTNRDRRHLQEYASEVIEEIGRRSSALSKPKRLEAAIPPNPALQNA
jgi:predicted PurR-regulated permease PerM/methylmalonyl-CoA mutase cobalamin-binding subunit